jgi:hypothetical protein
MLAVEMETQLAARLQVVFAHRLPNVTAEMALHGLAYNLARVMNIIGRRGLIVAIRAT